MTSISFPLSPSINQVYSAPNGTNYRYDGVKWTAIAGTTGATASIISNTAPDNPYPGLLWFNTEDGRLYARYETNWIDLSSPQAGTNALIYVNDVPPTNPVASQLWFSNADGKIYIRYNDTWIDTSPPAGGNTGDIGFNGSDIYRLFGLSLTNDDLTHALTSGVIIPPNGSGDLQFISYYGTTTITTGPDNSQTQTWTYGTDGILTLPHNNYLETVDINLAVGSQGDVIIRSNAADNINDKVWTFDTDGVLTLPTGGVIKNSDGSQYGGGGGSFNGVLNGIEDDTTPVIDFFSSATGNHIVTLASDWTMKIKARADGGNQGHLYLQAGNTGTKIKVNGNGSTVQICASDGSQVAWWEFDKTGKLTVPGEIWAKAGDSFNGITFSPDGSATYATLKVDDGANMVLNNYQNIYIKRSGSDRLAITDSAITLKSQDGTKSWAFGEDGHLSLPSNGDFAHIQAGTDKSINIQTTGTVSRLQVTPTDGVKIYTNNDANGWQFGNDGHLTFPDSKVQTTAWTGNTDEKIKFGDSAGAYNQGLYAISIGKYAGLGDQGTNGIAIGYGAGSNQQAINGIAIGSGAGNTNQGQGAIAIGGGGSGGNDQGTMSIAIGYNAGYTSQPAHTIILNASGTVFDAVASQTNSFYVNPIRSDNTAEKTLLYNTTTKEVTYCDRGAIDSNGNIVLTAGTAVFTFGTDGGLYIPGALDVEGAAIFNGDITFNGNVTLPGTINQVSGNSGQYFGDPVTGVGALYAGKTSFTPVPDTIFQTSGYVNGYIQNNLENTNPGNQASADNVITADNGTDTTGYIDMGMTSSGWDGTQSNSLGSAALANDGYLYVQNGTGTAGGNLILGATTSGKKVKIVAGGAGSSAIVADFSSTGLNVTGSVSATSFTGALTGNVTGNVSGNAGTVTNGVVTTGSYANPTWITSLAYSKLTGAPSLATVATSGSYTDLTSKPTLATVATSGSYTDLTSKPTLATVATSGDYADLTNKPTIPSAYTLPTADTSTLGGVKIDGTTITISNGVISAVSGAAAAGSLTGTTLASGVTASSLTSVGTLTSLQVSGALVRNGNMSQAAWGSNGVGLRLMNATYTDTSSATTLATSNVHYIGQPTLAFSNATTVSQANTVYISGAPAAGTNATLSVSYALNVASGNVNFGGNVKFNGWLQSGGGASMLSIGNSSITINGDATVVGQVYQANRPAFRVYGTGGQQTTTTNTTGVLNSTNWTQDFQQGTALNASTGVFTAPYAGLYQVNLVVRTYSNALGTASQAVIEKNTSTVILMVEWAANTTMNHTGASTVVKLAANDTLRFRVAQGSISFDANDNWSVAFLG